MIKWKTKLFGDNRLNFYSWLVVGIGVYGSSLFFVIKSIDAGAKRSPISLVLIAIYFVMVGQFGLALQSYQARVAAKLDRQDDLIRKTSTELRDSREENS